MLQHTSNNAAQMSELQVQVFSGLVLIAANWCRNTSRHMWCVYIMVREEGIVNCFSAMMIKWSRGSVFCCDELNHQQNNQQLPLFISENDVTVYRRPHNSSNLLIWSSVSYIWTRCPDQQLDFTVHWLHWSFQHHANWKRVSYIFLVTVGNWHNYIQRNKESVGMV